MELEPVRKDVAMKNEKGMTIVEVMAGFVVLLIVLAVFQGVLMLSVNMSERAQTQRVVNENLSMEAATDRGGEVGSLTLILTPDKMGSFSGGSLSLDLTAKVVSENGRNLYYWKNARTYGEGGGS